ncbi:sugar ABC transporter substrate-binding protein [Enterococcus dongliensis]|uniref:Sugar ABC transporter substrate-binding protein n=1 Tax=Enterococcus dongliensis TaxID=2559925 RepID=A0AAP5NHP1_9ENTE|nr:sugar ABC transporter substrate-binding protein [Enterococcus dongliensis]MDT2596645.1 sugar ABC transporter substrate-binding protein [Enterococcus dongliensis]MDT2604172.1 sugar ABC transporter substrate-binding protein [Enterococcus dongliensis]MDT2613484.1 sugar ABC transporter substrate-binding protein [Enterococcus dongliensis]MDT2634636.1 sugar ABC transporter substrate-binding protein [Enterococcus dongliensis]MDT2637540.1 sugar ABC transporter substrate-binding protein [Enterococcu
MKKVIIAVVTFCLALVSLSSCASEEKASNEIEVWLTPQWQGTYSADEKGADYDSFFKTAVKMYEKEHPGTKIDIQVIPGDERDSKLSVATQTNTLPDVFFESSFAMTNYAHQGLLEPFNSIIDKKNKADISEAIWDNVNINDKTYFYPFAQNPGMLVYNADMFKQAGLEKYIAGKDAIANWTMEDFKTVLTALKKNNDKVSPFGFYAKNNQGDTWNMMYLRMFGSSFYDESGQLNVNDKKGIAALDFIKELNTKGLIPSGAESLSSNDVNAMFQNQQVGISFANAVLYEGMLDNMKGGSLDKFDIRLANIPSMDGPQSFTYVLGSAVFNTNGEERMELAQDFVKFYSENQELVKASMNFLPVRESVIAEEADTLPLLPAYVNNDQYVINFSNNTPGYSEIRNALFPEIQATLTGEKSSKEALDSFVKSGNKAIDTGLRRSKALNDD